MPNPTEKAKFLKIPTYIWTKSKQQFVTLLCSFKKNKKNKTSQHTCKQCRESVDILVRWPFQLCRILPSARERSAPFEDGRRAENRMDHSVFEMENMANVLRVGPSHIQQPDV